MEVVFWASVFVVFVFAVAYVIASGPPEYGGDGEQVLYDSEDPCLSRVPVPGSGYGEFYDEPEAVALANYRAIKAGQEQRA